MHARVTTFKLRQGKIADAAEITRRSILPAAKNQAGFKSLLSLVDPESGEGMLITLWETESDVVASEANGYYLDQHAKLVGHLVDPPEHRSYAVLVQERT